MSTWKIPQNYIKFKVNTTNIFNFTYNVNNQSDFKLIINNNIQRDNIKSKEKSKKLKIFDHNPLNIGLIVKNNGYKRNIYSNGSYANKPLNFYVKGNIYQGSVKYPHYYKILVYNKNHINNNIFSLDYKLKPRRFKINKDEKYFIFLSKIITKPVKLFLFVIGGYIEGGRIKIPVGVKNISIYTRQVRTDDLLDRERIINEILHDNTIINDVINIRNELLNIILQNNYEIILDHPNYITDLLTDHTNIVLENLEEFNTVLETNKELLEHNLRDSTTLADILDENQDLLGNIGEQINNSGVEDLSLLYNTLSTTIRVKKYVNMLGNREIFNFQGLGLNIDQFISDVPLILKNSKVFLNKCITENTIVSLKLSNGISLEVEVIPKFFEEIT